MNKEHLSIIGGGISGCAFAYFLKKDFRITLYEKTPELGGLIRTRYNLENIPWQQVPSILHTNKNWIIDLFNKWIKLSKVNYKVSINPLFDFRYYDYPFTKNTIDTMPWHWKEAILLDLEKSNGENAENIQELITNFYGDTIYEVFYKNYFYRLFGTNEIDITDWHRPYMRDVSGNYPYYVEENIMFPINDGWNKLFVGLTEDVEIKYNTEITNNNLPQDEIIIFTGDVGKYFNIKNLYSYGSFDIDSTTYKSGSDTIIYPNYTPFIYMTQYGKYFTNYEKNIIVKTSIDDGNIPLFPIPTKKNKHIYDKVVLNNKNIIFAGRTGSWSFAHIDEIMDQAQKLSAQIKHSRRNK